MFADPRNAVRLADLASLLSRRRGNGLIARTRGGIYLPRSVVGGDGISVANGDGVAGDPTVAVASDVLRDADLGVSVQDQDDALDSLAGLSLVSGDILYATAADTLARLAKGSDGEVLTLASGLPSWAAGGAASALWALLAEDTSTSVATKEAEVFDDTYRIYRVRLIGGLPETDNVQLWFRWMDASALITTTVYAHGRHFTSYSGSSAAGGSSSDTKMIVATDVGSNPNEKIEVSVLVYRPLDAEDGHTTYWGQDAWHGQDAGALRSGRVFGRHNVAGSNLTGIGMQFSSGDIASGRFTVEGLVGSAD